MVGFGLAVVSLGLNGLALSRMDRPVEARRAPGISRWSELESRDPVVFAANLRAFGCPEGVIGNLMRQEQTEPVLAETARNVAAPGILSGDEGAARAFPTGAQTVPPSTPPSSFLAGGGAARAGQADGPATPTEAGGEIVPVSPSFSGGGAVQGARSRVLASPFVGTAPVSASPETAPGASGEISAETGAIYAPTADAKIPVAFEPLSPEIQLNGQQTAQLAGVQEEFARTVGNDGADGKGSASTDLENWRRAQAVADARFRALFGYQAFLAQERQALRNAADSAAQP